MDALSCVHSMSMDASMTRCSMSCRVAKYHVDMRNSYRTKYELVYCSKLKLSCNFLQMFWPLNVWMKHCTAEHTNSPGSVATALRWGGRIYSSIFLPHILKCKSEKKLLKPVYVCQGYPKKCHLFTVRFSDTVLPSFPIISYSSWWQH